MFKLLNYRFNGESKLTHNKHLSAVLLKFWKCVQIQTDLSYLRDSLQLNVLKR